MQCFLFPCSFPSSLPVIFHSTLLLLLRTLFSLSLQASPIGTHPIELHLLNINTHALQTKTRVVSATQAPIKVNDEDSCFIY